MPTALAADLVPCPELALSPAGTFHLRPPAQGAPHAPAPLVRRLEQAFEAAPERGLLALAGVDAARLSPSLAFGRRVAHAFLRALCRKADLETSRSADGVVVPTAELVELAAGAPPMVGAEYLSVDRLDAACAALAAHVTRELAAHGGAVAEWIRKASPAHHLVGRICLHLAENKRDEHAPFAFLATYATGVSAGGRVQHAPLGRAIEQFAGADDRPKLLALLEPLHEATQKSEVAARLVASGEVYHPLAWTPAEALAFLKDVPALEASGLVVRVPDWWHARTPPRPSVQVTLGARAPQGLGLEALLDVDLGVALGDETLSPAEVRALCTGAAGLRLVKGRWVEVDPERLRAVLDHWKHVEAAAKRDGLGFLEGMRLLAGLPKDPGGVRASDDAEERARVTAGPWLEGVLAELRSPEARRDADPGAALRGELRPYQRAGVAWLFRLARLGLGACLADDMGLGKTVQVIALLLVLKKKGDAGPNLLVVPASLLGNWRAELERFGPSLRALFAHPSMLEGRPLGALSAADLAKVDVVVTSYGALQRSKALTEASWGVVALDEAQAVKNPSAKQTRAVKALRARARLALTGTPVENRLGDLWSIFDFLSPGLLGSAKAFGAATKRLAEGDRGYGPLRELVRPYILRRMKTDRSVVADLPDKTEVKAFCSLTKLQAALYAEAVDELRETLSHADGMKRRGAVLASLMRLKQICNHPSQWLGDGAYRREDSGKLGRLVELCEPIAARQEKALVFTQFRELTRPLADALAEVFGRPGLVLSGETAVGRRSALVADFQREGGPPFFVLSLKAGGTGLNLTAASHVVHFDRWWNPAVEDQATDRAFRIGQKRNVLVHKLVCRGTVEEKIDALVEGKRALAKDVLASGSEAWLTELPSEEILRLVSLDLATAMDTG
jgi:non-specific serine/threonine protein kinase